MKNAMNRYDIKVEDNIQYIINYLINNSTLPDGLLAQKVYIVKDKIIGSKHNAEELGDYAQYIAFAGKIMDNQKYIEYVIRQIEIIRKNYQRYDGIIDLEPERRWLTIGEMDLYIGMVQIFLITHDNSVKLVIDKFYEGLFNKLVQGKSLIPSQLTKNLKFAIPIANPMDNGNHIELLGELYEATGEEKYVKWLQQLITHWLKNENFKNYGIFIRENMNFTGKVLSFIVDYLQRIPIFKNKFGKPSYTAKITKQNTHLLFGLLKYYELYQNDIVKEILGKWLETIDRLFLHSSGIHYGIYDLKHGYAYRLEVLHTINLIELLIEAHRIFKDESYLKRAKQYAKALINILTEDNLLLLFPFPEYDKNDPQRAIMEKLYGYYSLDPQIDFSVNLIKLFHITKNPVYQAAYQKILSATIDIFRHGHLYTEMVNKNTGEKWDVVRTKYLGLMLKPFLALEALSKEYSLNSFELRMILQDR